MGEGRSLRVRVQRAVAAIVGLLLLTGARPSPDQAAFRRQLVAAAVHRASVKVRYVSDYVRIPYPGGDVPADTGVCADEIIRIYRAVRIDLQRELHEDLVRAAAAYRLRGRPDTNIDHRRVKNLMVYFHRRGQVLPISAEPTDYRPGDIVAWDLLAGHIGMVVDQQGVGGRPLILHNVGHGPRIEDVLFSWPILGHYRYGGPPDLPP
jgi:uncharacterized protein YijF (DUF1287 family)